MAAILLLLASCGGQEIVAARDGAAPTEEATASGGDDGSKLGEIGQPCFANGTCAPGLTCVVEVRTTNPTMPAQTFGTCMSN